jgi:phosphatidyl-myo-inositol dimannoside synthase
MIVGLFTELLAAGGVQTAGRHTAAVLASFACQSKWPYEFLSLNDSEGEHKASVGGLDFTFRGFRRNKASFVRASLELARRKPRVVVAGHPHLAAPAVMMKLLSPGLQTVILSHGIEIWKPLSLFRRFALRRAGHVLAPSRDTASKLVSVQGIAESKVVLLPWAVDPDFLALASQADKLPLLREIPTGRVVLTVGRWKASERYKGVDTLLHAMSTLLRTYPDLHLVAVGDGDDLPRLENLAAKLEISPQVHFLRGLTKPELVACYARADVFALPSSGEGFGIVFLEAMALGKPVIGGAQGGITDIIESGRNGFLVPPGDAEQLAAVLKRLLNDARLRQGMGSSAKERVLTHYRFERFRYDLERLLGEWTLSLAN